MTIDDLCKSTGEWLRGEDPASSVVISSRIRLARNLSDHSFLASANETEKTEIFRAVEDVAHKVPALAGGIFVDLQEASKLERRFLVERHLISRQHAGAKGSRGVGVSKSETTSVMINEEDHLRIQGLRCGFQLDSLWQEISSVDDVFGASLPFAFDEQFGFLTACPTNVGTGIRVSVMLHLPALKLTKEIDRVVRAARDMRLAVRGLYGEGTEAIGDLYQVSNQITLGKTEEEILSAFGEGIIPKIVDYENAARDSLIHQHPNQLEDKIWRAHGILSHARCISSEETLVLLSPIRMGLEMGRYDRIDMKTLNEIFLFTQPAHLQKISGEMMDGKTRGRARASFIRSRINA